MNTEKSIYMGIRSNLEEKKLVESDAASMGLSLSEYIRYKLITERTQRSDSSAHGEKQNSTLKSLDFLEENYKDLARMIFSTQIAVNTLASCLLTKDNYDIVNKLYDEAFDLYGVTNKDYKKDESSW